VTPEQIAQMVEALAVRLKEQPDNVQGWLMLARSYNALGRYPEAAQAYAQLVQRVPDDAQLLADYADVLAMTQNRDLSGEPERLIRRAVEIDGNNVKALALLGTLEFNRQNFAKAAESWQKILPLVPPESDFARNLQSSIAEAQQKGGLAVAPAAAKPAPAAAAGGGRVSGKVTLAPELAAKAAPTDTVFVFARAAQGPRMPLVILRKQVKDLPAEFVLDDSMAMSPNMRLSSVPQVVVGARISKTGNASVQPGDLEGLSQPVAAGASGLAIVIDREVR
jgi:cytochrome c-type biogenesis protein CcmH